MNLNYIYHNPNEIFKDIIALKDFSVIEIIILLICVISFIVFLLYIFPILYSLKEEFLKQKEKKKKKFMLQKIILQKELEDEILAEIKQKK